MPGQTFRRAGILLACLLLFVAGLCLQPLEESDFFFRLRVGQEILRRHALLEQNTFSFTAPLHPDLDLSWAFEVFAALIHRLGGFRVVVVAKASWLALTFAGLFALSRRRGASVMATTAVLAMAAFVMRDRFVERPHIVSFAGELAILWALEPVTERRSLWRGAAFAVGMLLWANMHAGIFAGVLMAGGAASERMWKDRDRSSAGPSRTQARRRGWLITAIVAAAAAATPVGPFGLVRYLMLHITLPQAHAVDEFRAPTWRSDASFFVWAAVLLTLWMVNRWWPRPVGGEPMAALDRHRSSLPPSVRVAHAVPAPAALGPSVPLVVMVMLASWSVRFCADAVLISAPLAAALVTNVHRRAKGLLWVRWHDHQRAMEARFRIARVAGEGFVAFCLLTATVAPRLAAARAGRPWIDVDVNRASLPLDGLRFVTQLGLRERMYNDFEVGSYLLFEGYPRYRVFIDPRLPAYPLELHRLLGAFDLDRATWGAAMERYGVESALLAYAGINRRVAWWDPAEWALVYRAQDTRVFVRRRAKWAALIAAHEIPATFDFTLEEGTTTSLLEIKPSASSVPDCEWQRRLGELAFELDRGSLVRARDAFERALEPAGCLEVEKEARLSAWLGVVEMPQDLSHALIHLTRALALAPQDTATRANRARALEELGRLGDAAEEWERVARAEAHTDLGRAAASRARALAARTGIRP